MKKKNLLEEVELYVDPRPLTEIESQEISDYIAKYNENKSIPVLSRKTRKEKTKKEKV